MEYNAFNETHRAETYKSVITISLEVLKGLILVNGGAAAGMIATLDKLTQVISAAALQAAMICFVLGLVAAVAAGIGGYFTQFTMHEKNMGRASMGKVDLFRKTTIGLCVLSLIAFATGALTAAFNLNPIK